MAMPRIPLPAAIPLTTLAAALACGSKTTPTEAPAAPAAPSEPVPATDSGPPPSVYPLPRAEVKETDIELEMPAVPAFEAPKSSGDHRSPRELHLAGRKLLGSKVQARGFVTWKYDCATAGTGPQGPFGKGSTLAARKKMVAQDPLLCWRPHFYLGDTANTPPEKSIWVVEVPRPWRKDEKKAWSRLPEDLKAENPPPVIVPHEVGDEVIITGTWNLKSPKGFANSEGLLVYESMQNLTRPARKR